MGSVSGSVGNRGILSSVDCAFRSNGVCKVCNGGNSNGAVLLETVTNFVGASGKCVGCGRGTLRGSVSILPSLKTIVRGVSF